jgi:outer membrane protein assembly factor BamE (lipoprotein component of BamABCDE complex)
MATGTSPRERLQPRDELPVRRRPSAVLALAFALAAAALGGCVTEDATTGENIPRGNQRYEFSKVEKYAEQLRDGMTKAQVLMLLGSAAEMDDAGDTWIYLPERYGILIPARALQLEFKNSVLVSHGYRPIVLGMEL